MLQILIISATSYLPFFGVWCSLYVKKKKNAKKIYYENHRCEINHDAREHHAVNSEAINKRKRSAYAANSEKNKMINAARRAKYAANAAQVSKMKLLSCQSNSYPLTVDCYIYFV